MVVVVVVVVVVVAAAAADGEYFGAVGRDPLAGHPGHPGQVVRAAARRRAEIVQRRPADESSRCIP